MDFNTTTFNYVYSESLSLSLKKDTKKMEWNNHSFAMWQMLNLIYLIIAIFPKTIHTAIENWAGVRESGSFSVLKICSSSRIAMSSAVSWIWIVNWAVLNAKSVKGKNPKYKYI